MSENEYKEFVDFFGKQLEKIYDRLKNTATKDDLANTATKDDLANFTTKDDLANFATKDDLAAAKEETMRHTGILIEEVNHNIDIVIETVMGINEKLDRRTGENEEEHARLDKRTLINSADISKLDQRVERLEGESTGR